MDKIGIGNAPCSWGTLEFEGLGGEKVAYAQMLDELAETGYSGTELGDWGYMPTDPKQLSAELNQRKLVMLGAFVPIALKDPSTHQSGINSALKVARLLAAVGTSPQPYLVLADNNGSVTERTKNAGRISPVMGLNYEEWKTFSGGATEVARAVFVETGLRTVFHHHCGGYVETPDEIARLLDLTDPQVLGLVFDTGHYVYGSGQSDVMKGLQRFADRIWYIHFKDCHPGVAAEATTHQWDYFDAVRHGVFCELGKGCVDFRDVVGWLKKHSYTGYGLVEQDVLPGMGKPRESAARNRVYLKSLGL